MTNHKEAIEKILKIQESFDVNSVTYRDLYVWPLIRQHIWSLLINSNLKVSNSSPEHSTRLPGWKRILSKIIIPTKYKDQSNKILFGNLFFWQQKKYIKKNGNSKVLFLSRSEYYTTKINYLNYDQIIDPVIELLDSEINYLKIGLRTPRMEATIPQFEPTILYNPRLFLFWYKLAKKFSLKQRSIENFLQLKQVVLEIIASISIDESYFLKVISEIEAHYSYFTYLFSILKPHVIFMPCFYSVPHMSLIWACKNLNIETVDVQHGKQGKYHGSYSHLTRIPVDGYQLYPDVFWVWGKESKDNIERWKPPGSRHHQVIVGGNLWLAKWLKNDDLVDKTSVEWIKSIIEGYEKIILFSLQQIDTPIPEHLIKAMKLSPDTWIWLLRLHPRQRNQQDQITEFLELNGVENFEVEYSTYAPLYALLKNVDHHITCWSSVCFEALAFNVQTTIIHPYGRILYDEDIIQGKLLFTLKAAEILSNISEIKLDNKDSLKEPYIETDLLIAKNALNVILSRDEQDKYFG